MTVEQNDGERQNVWVRAIDALEEVNEIAQRVSQLPRRKGVPDGLAVLRIIEDVQKAPKIDPSMFRGNHRDIRINTITSHQRTP